MVHRAFWQEKSVHYNTKYHGLGVAMETKQEAIARVQACAGLVMSYSKSLLELHAAVVEALARSKQPTGMIAKEIGLNRVALNRFLKKESALTGGRAMVALTGLVARPNL